VLELTIRTIAAKIELKKFRDAEMGKAVSKDALAATFGFW